VGDEANDDNQRGEPRHQAGGGHEDSPPGGAVAGVWGVLPGAEAILRTLEFDLVIVSGWLQESEKRRILAAAGKTPALVLTEMTFADKLLAQVERQLTVAAQED
jgi:hypothetical protein